MLELDRDLSKSSKDYREEKSDRKVTVFKVSVNGLVSQTYKQLGSLVPKDPTSKKELDELVNAGCRYIAESVFNSVKARGYKIKGSSYWAFSVVVDSGIREAYGTKNIFDTIKSFYTAPRNTFIDALNTFFKLRGKDALEGGSFFNLEHVEGSSVAEQQVVDIIKKFGRRGSAFVGNGGDITSKDLEELGLELFISKKGVEDRDILIVKLGSQKLNLLKAGSESALKQIYRDSIKEALLRLDTSENFVNRPGSDSRIVIEKKKIKNRFVSKIKNNKRVKKPEKEKINYSKGKDTLKIKKRKSVVINKEVPIGALSVKSYRGKATKKEEPYQSLIGLQTLINAKLPGTVKKNMVSPALQNRTGRFAESVRVEEIRETKKGFPSIGYTYQKNPYQIFEQGAGKTPWANSDRDPRKLIDSSIREIAIGLIEGRFFTRRM